MATAVWILAFVLGVFAFLTFLANDEQAAALAALVTIAMLVIGASTANQRGREADGADSGTPRGMLTQIIDEFVELHVGWHVLGVVSGAVLFGLSIWQYGGISWAAIALVGVTLAFGLLILVGRSRRRQRNHPQ